VTDHHFEEQAPSQELQANATVSHKCFQSKLPPELDNAYLHTTRDSKTKCYSSIGIGFVPPLRRSACWENEKR